MPFTKETAEGKTVVKLEESLTIYDTPALHEAFAGCLEGDGEITVDVGGVTECDAAGLQLLCAVRKATRMEKKPFQISGTSDAVSIMLQRLGLTADEIA